MSELPVVPFGKYKDKPITELLNDPNYLDWCKNQPWFQSKFPIIYNIAVTQSISSLKNDQPTPGHNKLQNWFLSKQNQIIFIDKNYNTKQNKIYYTKLFQNEDYIRLFGKKDLSIVDNCIQSSIEFEDKNNWDVVIKNNFYLPNQEFWVHPVSIEESKKELKNLEIFRYKTYWESNKTNVVDENGYSVKDKSGNWIHDDNKRESYIEWKQFVPIRFNIYIEIKTTLGDDYPCVLRKMKNQIQLTKDKSGNYYLLIQDFESKVTSKEELVMIFSQSNIKVIFFYDLISKEYFKNYNLITSLEEKIKSLEEENIKLKEQLNGISDN